MMVAGGKERTKLQAATPALALFLVFRDHFVKLRQHHASVVLHPI